MRHEALNRVWRTTRSSWLLVKIKKFYYKQLIEAFMPEYFSHSHQIRWVTKIFIICIKVYAVALSCTFFSCHYHPEKVNMRNAIKFQQWKISAYFTCNLTGRQFFPLRRALDKTLVTKRYVNCLPFVSQCKTNLEFVHIVPIRRM